MEDIFFRYEDTMTHYSVDKMADAAGEDADVELKQNREDISLRLDGETRTTCRSAIWSGCRCRRQSRRSG